MFKKILIIAMIAVGAYLPEANAAKFNFVLDLKPLGVLVSPDVDGFRLHRSWSGSYISYSEEAKIEGNLSFLPSLHMGLGLDTKSARYIATGGVAYLWNAAFDGPMYFAQAEIKFKLGSSITLGPRVGVVFSDDFYFQDVDKNEVWLSARSGMQGMLYGLDFTAGGKRVAFHLSLDYMSLKSYDVHISPHSDWRSNMNELDLSGGVLNAGIVFYF